MEEINLGEYTLTRYLMLYIEEYETAVMADFHLGFEDVMAQQGLFLPKLQYPQIMDTLEKVIEKYAPTRLVVNGDLKHEFSKNMPQEWREIEEMVDFISDRTQLVVIRGNHDNFLGSILKRRGIPFLNSFSIGKFLMVHGHRKVEIPEGKVLIMGHEHPSITVRDEVMASTKLPCFLISDSIIVLPAVSIYALGTDVSKSDFISPILRERRERFRVYAVGEDSIIPLDKFI